MAKSTKKSDSEGQRTLTKIVKDFQAAQRRLWRAEGMAAEAEQRIADLKEELKKAVASGALES